MDGGGGRPGAHVRQADIRCRGGEFHDPSQHTRHKTDEPTASLPVCQSARPTRAVIAEAWMGLRTDVRLSAKFARSQSGGRDRVRVAVHGTELERGGGELGNDHWTHQHQRSQGLKWGVERSRTERCRGGSSVHCFRAPRLTIVAPVAR